MATLQTTSITGSLSATGELFAVSNLAKTHTGNVEAYYQLSKRLQAFNHLGSTTVLEIEALTPSGGYAGAIQRTTWRLSSRSQLYVTRHDENGGATAVTLKILNDTTVSDANGQNAKYVVGLICGTGSSYRMAYLRARFVEYDSTSCWVTIAQMATATPTTVSGSAMTYSSGWIANTNFTDTSFTEVIVLEKASQLTLTATTGTAPLVVSSTTLVSNLNAQYLNGQLGSYYLNAANLTGTISGDRGVTAGSSSVSFVEYNGTTATAGQFDGGSTAPSATTRLNYGGYLYAARLYAPIFYDADNVNYYLDPAGASVLNGLRFAPSGNNVSGNDAIISIVKPDDADWAIQVSGSREYGIDLNMAATHTYAFRSLKAGTEYFRIGSDYLYHDTSIRAPIFYDTNDTNYYLDPASTSNLAIIKADAGANYPHSFTNTDAGNTHWTNRNDRLLTSNGTNWATDGRDPIMALVTSGNSNATTIANSIGLTLHNESQTNNTFSPAITFSNRSNSGNYNSVYAAIIGKKTGQGVDSNWSAGELHFYTMPVGAYENDVPSLLINSAGNVGIGTTNPATLLQIGTGTPTSTTSGIQFGDDTGTRIYRDVSNRIRTSGNITSGGYLQTANNQIYPNSFSNTLNINVGNTAQDAWIAGIELSPGGNVRIPGGIVNSGLSAQWSVSGGGTATFNGTAILWSQRVIAIPVEKTEFSNDGYIDITCPTSGTVTYYNSSNVTTTVTCTANGIPLGAWEALYYEVTPGQANTSDQTKFRVVAYPNSTWRPSSNWLLLAIRTTDVEVLKWIPGQANIKSGGKYDFSRVTEYFYANDYYLNGATSTYLRSNNAFNFLTNAGGAQNGKFNGIQVSSDYSGTVPTDGILFGTDTNLYRTSADTLKTDDSLIINSKCAVATSISATYTVDINGSLHYTSASASSDARFKKNIEPIDNALIKLNNVRGVKFEWNEFVNARRNGYELNKPTLGVIAQELEAVFPELVDHWHLSDDCPDARAVNYEKIIPVLIEAVKELNNKNIQLEARLSALESKLQ